MQRISCSLDKQPHLLVSNLYQGHPSISKQPNPWANQLHPGLSYHLFSFSIFWSQTLSKKESQTYLMLRKNILEFKETRKSWQPEIKKKAEDRGFEEFVRIQFPLWVHPCPWAKESKRFSTSCLTNNLMHLLFWTPLPFCTHIVLLRLCTDSSGADIHSSICRPYVSHSTSVVLIRIPFWREQRCQLHYTMQHYTEWKKWAKPGMRCIPVTVAFRRQEPSQGGGHGQPEWYSLKNKTK